ncbi:MAG: sensor histidine kinase [Longimicrobiales bacterium]
MRGAARVIPSVLKRMRSHRPQLAALVVLLAGSLVLTGLLAFQGYLAATNHSEQAEKWLIDWADQIAHRWDERVQTAMRFALFYSFKHLLEGDLKEIPDPGDAAQLIAAKDFCACISQEDIRAVFVYDFGEATLRTTGDTLPATVLNWITNAIVDAQSNRIEPSATGRGVVGAPDGVARAIFFVTRLGPDTTRRVTYGFETDADAIARFFDATWQPDGLLLASVARGRPIDTFFSARVADASGHEWFRSPRRYEPRYTAAHSMDHFLRNLDVTVSVRPGAADDLLIGGVPGSRLPTLFALLVLTVGVLGASIVLIRREADIARLRADFIAGVSHELRTPLAQIRMFSETLMLGRVRGEEERKRSLAIIDQEARRLTHLVENVLLFARAERRSGRINPERIDLAAEVRDAVHGFAILCRSQAIEIRPELQEDVGVTVDRGALRQVLLNLLDNAVKYGPIAQRVTVGMALFDGAARVWVDDEGKGIPEADRHHVFESFYRLDRDIDSAVAGSGIGLAIVRELINLHSGRVWIEDAPGGGARIVAELPGAYLRSDTVKDDWAVA